MKLKRGRVKDNKYYSIGTSYKKKKKKNFLVELEYFTNI